MEKYITDRNTTDTTNTVLADIYKDVVYKRQMVSTRVDAVKANSDTTSTWRGDHSFSSEAAKYSFLNFIEPDVAQKHPDWSKEKIRKEALVKFQQRLEQDLSYEQQEAAHVESAVQWKVVETTPGQRELATEYGGETVTLRQLWDHTREYAAFVKNPAAYNQEEEKAQYAMEQAFVHGEAQSYVTVLSHPDAVRYVQIWERGEDGEVASKQLDLYKTVGRDLSFEEGNALIRHLAQYTTESTGQTVQRGDADYAHFMLSSGTVGESDIRTIATMQIAQTREFLQTSTLHYSIDTISHAAIGATYDTKQALGEMRHYLGDTMGQAIHDIQKKFLDTPSTQNTQEKMTHPHTTAHEQTSAHRQPDAEDGHTLSPNEEAHKESAVKTILSEWIISQTMIDVVSLYPESAGGALFWLVHMAQKDIPIPEDGPSKQPTTVVETMRSLMRSMTKLFETPSAVHADNKPAPLVRIEEIHTGETDQGDHKTQRPFDAFLHALLGEDKEPLSLKNVFVMMRHIASIAWPVLEGSSPQRSHFPMPEIPGNAVSENTHRDRAVHRVTFALLYWFILSEIGQGLQSLPKKHPEQLLNPNTNKDVMQEPESPKAAQPPWILLSIIWYLTMLREGGMAATAQATSAQSVVDPIGVTAIVLPSSGIIFLRSFVIE